MISQKGCSDPDSSSDTGNSPARDAADDYSCPICLQPVSNECYAKPCFHQFCFSCLLQWAEYRPRCPLCNADIACIIQQDIQNSSIIQTPIHDRNLGTSSESRINQHTSERRVHVTQFGRHPTLLDADGALGRRKRRAVYSNNLTRVVNEDQRWGPRISQSATLLHSAIATQRCRQWIRRDLQVILNTDDVSLVEILVVSLVRQVKDGELIVNAAHGSQWSALYAFLGDKLAQFLDELCAFLDSSLDMHSYDKYTAYNTCT